MYRGEVPNADVAGGAVHPDAAHGARSARVDGVDPRSPAWSRRAIVAWARAPGATARRRAKRRRRERALGRPAATREGGRTTFAASLAVSPEVARRGRARSRARDRRSFRPTRTTRLRHRGRASRVGAPRVAGTPPSPSARHARARASSARATHEGHDARAASLCRVFERAALTRLAAPAGKARTNSSTTRRYQYRMMGESQPSATRRYLSRSLLHNIQSK